MGIDGVIIGARIAPNGLNPSGRLIERGKPEWHVDRDTNAFRPVKFGRFRGIVLTVFVLWTYRRQARQATREESSRAVPTAM